MTLTFELVNNCPKIHSVRMQPEDTLNEFVGLKAETFKASVKKEFEI